MIIEADRIFQKDEAGKVVADITLAEILPGIFVINHTFVDESLRGQGIASKLVQTAIDEIERHGGQVKATCSYAVKWLKEHGITNK